MRSRRRFARGHRGWARDARPATGRQLVRGVAAVTAVIAVIGALWLASTTRRTAERAALQAHAESVGVLANLLLPAALANPAPTAGNRVDPATAASLDRLLDQAWATRFGLDGAALHLYTPNGRLLYSYPAHLGGADLDTLTAVPRLGPGEATARFLSQQLPGQPSRRFELNMAFGPGPSPDLLQVSGPAMVITGSVQGDIHRAQLAEFTALAVLWVSLIGAVLVLSRRLRRHARQSNYLAFHDALTGLANRALFNDRLLAAVSAAAEAGGRVGLLLVDLNRFKELNDTLGHHSGDAVLRDVARSIARELRSTDLVARLGGDEFAVLVARPRHIDDVELVAERISAALASTTHLGELAVTVDAAIGVTAFPDHGTDAATLMRRADLAMYAAKAARLPWQRYEESITSTAVSTLTLPTELRTALATDPGQLIAHYHPIIDAANQLVAVEAVARWSHPSRGLLPASAFVPLAERIGVGATLSKRMVEVVLAQAEEWHRRGARIPIALNVGASELQNAQLADDIGEGLHRRGLSSNAIIIELTQASLPARPDAAADLVAGLRRHGITVALDEFGSGSSSIAALRDIPADILKLDRGLLMELGPAGPTTEIVRSTIELAHNLGILVVASGADRLEQVDVLARCGCDWAQGAAIGPPMSPAELLEWAAQRQSRSTILRQATRTAADTTSTGGSGAAGRAGTASAAGAASAARAARAASTAGAASAAGAADGADGASGAGVGPSQRAVTSSMG